MAAGERSFIICRISVQHWELLTKPGSLLGVQRAHERVVWVASTAASSSSWILRLVLVDGEGEHGEGHGEPGRDRGAQADRREQELEGERQASLHHRSNTPQIKSRVYVCPRQNLPYFQHRSIFKTIFM